MKPSKTLIGIVPDYRSGGKSDYSLRPYYALKCNYVDMINHAGAAAFMLTYDYEMIDYYLEIIDGLMIVGGYFDINPKKYGETEIHPMVKLNEIRENFEHEITDKALKKGDLPILGICNGMQLINALHKGKVIQHIPDDTRFIDHEQSHHPDFTDYAKPYHDVIIEKDSKLFEIIGEQKIKTNSSHHQAVKEVGSQIKISGKAEDGIIEAIEHKTHPFCLGVQWHPEFEATKADKKIFSAFASACQKNKITKK